MITEFKGKKLNALDTFLELRSHSPRSRPLPIQVPVVYQRMCLYSRSLIGNESHRCRRLIKTSCCSCPTGSAPPLCYWTLA